MLKFCNLMEISIDKNMLFIVEEFSKKAGGSWATVVNTIIEFIYFTEMPMIGFRRVSILSSI